MFGFVPESRCSSHLHHLSSLSNQDGSNTSSESVHSSVVMAIIL